MQLTNLKVGVEGDKAVAEMFWSSLDAKSLVTKPDVPEYGRERTELVKPDGRWLISRRIVTSYGSMPKALLSICVPR